MKARIRSLKPEMWADEKITALSRDARLLLLGLVTMADDEGRFRARTSQIFGHVFPADEDALTLIPVWIDEIKQQGLVVFYIVDGVPYGAFRHWRRHQKINKPSPSPLPPPPDRRIVRDNSVPATGNGRDSSGSDHVALRDLTGSVPSFVDPRHRSDPDPIRSLLHNGSELQEPQRALLLSALLAAHIRCNDPKANPDPEKPEWVRDMRLLLTDRKGDLDEVVRIIDWCQADSFWHSNILSPAKLRKQFSQLVMKAKTPANVTSIATGRRENASDMLRDIHGIGGAA